MPDDDPLGVVSAFPEDRVDAVHVGPLSLDALERVLRAKVGKGSPGPRSSASTRCREAIPSSPRRSDWRSFAAEATWRPANGSRSGPPPGTHRGPPRGSPCADHRSPGDRLGPVGTDAGCDRCGDRSFGGVDRRLGPAIENGVVEAVGDGLRFTHPLLASAVYQKIPPARRRELHAQARDDRPRSGGTSPPPGSVRGGPGRRRRRRPRGGRPLASSRGAPQSAAELWEMARRATPPDRGEDLVRRTHQAGVAHHECGDTALARSVLEQAVDLSVAGPARARVLLDLGMAPRRERRVAGGLGRVRGCSGRGGGRSRRSGRGSSRTSGTPGCSGGTSRHRNGTLARRWSWPRSCRNRG